jgi:hypothetical protein
MPDMEKIVAAILAVGYAAQNGGGTKTQHYLELYEEFLAELSKPKLRQMAETHETPNEAFGTILRRGSPIEPI